MVDVETNGLSPDGDSPLCIAVYDPVTEESAVRYLPLDLQDVVLTTHVNGITEGDLAGKEHLSQEEINNLFDRFGFPSKTILSYSGSDFPSEGWRSLAFRAFVW